MIEVCACDECGKEEVNISYKDTTLRKYETCDHCHTSKSIGFVQSGEFCSDACFSSWFQRKTKRDQAYINSTYDPAISVYKPYRFYYNIKDCLDFEFLVSDIETTSTENENVILEVTTFTIYTSNEVLSKAFFNSQITGDGHDMILDNKTIKTKTEYKYISVDKGKLIRSIIHDLARG